MASETLAKMRKKWGKNIIQLASDERVREKFIIPSGIFQLDWALGGGWTAGRINTVYGLKSSSKTTCMLNTIGQAQLLCASCFSPKNEEGHCRCKSFREHVCAFIDVEGTWDDKWAKAAGVRTESLVYARPEYAEQSLDILETFLRSGDVDLIVLDSLAFLTPMKEIEESTDKETMGAQARVVGKGTRKLVAALTTLVIFINQIRMKIGVMFGNPETQPAGLAPQFASTAEVKMWAGKYHMDETTGKATHVDMNFRVDKNKSMSPRMEGEFRLMLSGTETKQPGSIYDEEAMIKYAEKFGLVEGSGNSWTAMGEKFGGKSLIERKLLTDPSYKKNFKETLMKVLLAV